jgi:hypothetical protein
MGVVVANGLKSWVMLFSGELSITRAGCAPPPVLALAPPLELPLELPVLALVELLLEEQAAIPAARRPAAAMAASRLPLWVLVVDIDYPLG